MDPAQREFVLKNRAKLSSRQMAKTLGIPRTEVDKLLRDTASRPASTAPAAWPEPGPRVVWVTLAALAALTLVWRLAYTYFLSQTPFFEPLSIPLPKKMDDGLYHQMAVDIASGNWAGDFPLGLYRTQLYAYFLALLYKFFGTSFAVVHYAQAALGTGSVLLTYALTRRVFGRHWTALTAAALYGMYAPFLFFEHFLLGETLSIFLNLAAVTILAGVVGRPAGGWRSLFSAGLLMGLSSLARPNTLLCAVSIALFLVWARGRARGAAFRWGRAALSAFCFLAACLAALAPMLARNQKVYGDLVPVSAIGGVNFYLGNNPKNQGAFMETEGLGGNLDDILEVSIRKAEADAGRRLKASEVSAYWFRKGAEFFASSPATVWGVYQKKIALFFRDYETPDILDMYFVRDFVPMLAAHRFTGFGFLLIFALFGAAVSRRVLGPPAGLVCVMAASYSASVLLFFVSSRYRLPAVPFLIPFSAAGVWGLVSALKPPRPARLALLGAIALALAVPVFKPGEDYTATNLNRLGVYYEYKGDLAKAEEYYLKSIEKNPREAYAYNNYAVLLNKMGRDAEAEAMAAKSEELLALQMA